jgi:hypothetical protein
MISPQIGKPHFWQDKEIELRKGWNLFGYSGIHDTSWSSLRIKNSTTTKNIFDNNWIQPTFYFYNRSSYGLTPSDDAYLRPDWAYWVYANTNNVTLIIPNIGYDDNASENWQNSLFYNGSDLINLSAAQSESWLQGTIYYFDSANQYYGLIPGDDNYIYPWRGYWLYSNQDDLQLIIS